MLNFVVMPCLDEAAGIADAIGSLGFGATGGTPDRTELIVVDNGSTDGTPDVLDAIRRRSASPIHVVAETVRGYVPPRSRGVVTAEALVRSSGYDPGQVLILQADADTIYKPGYVAAMSTALGGDHGLVLEGSTRHPPEFLAAHPDYIAAERLADDEVEALDLPDEQEVVMDDKVCGYRLSDYQRWGGLFEETTDAGDAIHAETSRMFIRARLMHGARKRRVNPAGAASSRRKVFEDPWLHYATVGFPREASWICRTAAGRSAREQVDAFARSVLIGWRPDAVRLRRAHQLALFRHLPALVAVAGGSVTVPDLPRDVAKVLAALPAIGRDDVAKAPGAAVESLLALIDGRPDLFPD